MQTMQDQGTYTIFVEWTDRMLNQDKSFRTGNTIVKIMAPHEAEAIALAAQMVTSIRGHLDCMVTQTTILEVEL